MSMIEIFNSSETMTCILCGDELSILKKKIDGICDFCGKPGTISHECSSMHLICDQCMDVSVSEFVESQCLEYKGNDPMELAVKIMNSPIIKMHGSEHHFIVPAVLLTCIHNHKKSNEDLKAKLAVVLERALKETSQKCSYNGGTCGAAYGTGVFLSVFMDRDLHSEDEWSYSTGIVANSLKKISDHGGPRCCKRDTYLSLQASIEYLKDKFALDLPFSDAKCTFSNRNHDCGHEQCDFYDISYSLV